MFCSYQPESSSSNSTLGEMSSLVFHSFVMVMH